MIICYCLNGLPVPVADTSRYAARAGGIFDCGSGFHLFIRRAFDVAAIGHKDSGASTTNLGTLCVEHLNKTQETNKHGGRQVCSQRLWKDIRG